MKENFLLKLSVRPVSSLSCRQCALVALQDVKAYLTEEGGQIAVRTLCLSVHLSSCLSLSLSLYWLIPKRFEISRTDRNTSGFRKVVILNCPTNILPQETHVVQEKNLLCPIVFLSGFWCNKHNKRKARPHSRLCERECIQGKIGRIYITFAEQWPLW